MSNGQEGTMAAPQSQRWRDLAAKWLPTPAYLATRSVRRSVDRAWQWQWGLWQDLGSTYRAFWLKRVERRQAESVGAYKLREAPLLAQARAEHARRGPEPANPLVSVTIATWNRAQVLVERTLPTVFAQTYPHFEVVIVGDGCTDDTEARVAAIGDPRIRFENLAQRGTYPKDREHRHMVAGTYPINRALSLARGQWIAHLDDDDQWTPNHLERLLRHAQAHDCELVWSKSRVEREPGRWDVEGGADFALCNIPHSTAVFRSYLRLFEFDSQCWRLTIGCDRHVMRRMWACGVRPGFVDEVTMIAQLRPGTTRPFAMAEDRD